MDINENIHKYIPSIALAMLIFVTLACGSSSRTNPPQVSTATSIPPPALSVDANTPVAIPTTPTVNVQEPLPTYLGDMVEQNGFSLSAVTVEDPATRPTTMYKPEAGKKLVAVEYIVGNVSSETFSSFPLYATLVDTDGFLYSAGNTIVENQLEFLNVAPGEKVRGWSGFIVPQNAIPASLKYRFAAYQMEETELQVGLTTK